MRLIDAHAADVNEICCFYGSECGLENVKEWLDGQPTVDAELVRHGQWDSENRCTVCGRLCATVMLKDGTRRTLGHHTVRAAARRWTEE